MKTLLCILLAVFCTTAQAEKIDSEESMYTLSYSLQDRSLQLNEYEELPVQISTANSETPCCDKIEIYAGMPGHGHGMPSKPVIAKQSNNLYLIKGLLFSMPGQWVITLILFQEDEEVDRFVLRLTL